MTRTVRVLVPRSNAALVRRLLRPAYSPAFHRVQTVQPMTANRERIQRAQQVMGEERHDGRL